MTTSQTAATERALPRLPEIGDRSVPGARLVRRAVSITLSVFGLLLIVAAVVSVFAGITDTIDADGVLEPIAVREVRAFEAGVIAKMLVRTGDRVRTNQVVALIDPTEAESRIADLEAREATLASEIRRLRMAKHSDQRRTGAAIAQAISAVAKARANLRQRMAEFGIFGDADSVAQAQASRIHIGLDGLSADLLLAKTALQVAIADSSAVQLTEAELEQKQIDTRRVREQLVVARSRRERQQLRASASGVVLTEEVESLVGSMMGAGQTILEVGDMSHWRAVLALDERDVRRVQLGDTATIEIPALAELADNRFVGRVIDVAPQPIAFTATISAAKGAGYRVVVSLDSANLEAATSAMFRRGYIVHGKIVGERGSLISLAVHRLRAKVRGGLP